MTRSNHTIPDHQKFYGRRKGHTLSGRQQELMESLLPELLIQVDLESSAPINPHGLFDGPREEVWFEVGFGKGEHMRWQVEANPNIGMIGCEPYINGVAGLLTHIEDTQCKAIRLYDDDARHILRRLPEASIDKFFLLHPDPWPKRRHAKRRFLSPENLDEIARVLKDEGEFRVAHDLPIYQEWIAIQMCQRTDFIWTAESRGDWTIRADDWPETRYEAKSKREGRTPLYFRYKRRSRQG